MASRSKPRAWRATLRPAFAGIPFSRCSWCLPWDCSWERVARPARARFLQGTPGPSALAPIRRSAARFVHGDRLRPPADLFFQFQACAFAHSQRSETRRCRKLELIQSCPLSFNSFIASRYDPRKLGCGYAPRLPNSNRVHSPSVARGRSSRVSLWRHPIAHEVARVPCLRGSGQSCFGLGANASDKTPSCTRGNCDARWRWHPLDHPNARRRAEHPRDCCFDTYGSGAGARKPSCWRERLRDER